MALDRSQQYRRKRTLSDRSYTGKIVLDQYDLEKVQLYDGALNLIRSWFNKITFKVDDKKKSRQINSKLFTAMCYSCIQGKKTTENHK